MWWGQAEKERGQADRGTETTVTWAVAVLMENKSRRIFRTWKQADWRDKKAGKLSMKGIGFLLEWGERGKVRDKDRVVQYGDRET